MMLAGARPLWLLGMLALAVYAVTAADGYAIRLLTVAGIWALMGIGYQLVFGHVGALSLAQGAFFGVGAYAASLTMSRLGLPFGIGLVLAALLPGLLAALVAIPVLRLETHYFALATLGIAQIVHLVVVNWESITGGANGIAVAPAPAWLAPGGLAWLGFVWLLVALAGFAVARITDGLAGRTLALLREEPLAAASLGIDIGQVRLWAFVAGAVLAGMAGALSARTAGVVSPEAADLPLMVMCLTLVVVGGRRHVAGAILGALLVTHLPEWFRFLDRGWLVAYGIATLLIVIAAPEGVVGTVDAWGRRWRERRARAATLAMPSPVEVPPSPSHALGVSPSLSPGHRSASLILPGSAGGEGLVVQGLEKSFGGVRALDGVSLMLAPGEILGVIGPNGSGKTTLINLLSGIERPQAGAIALDGQTLQGAAPHVVALHGVARSFQNLALPGELSARDNVAAGCSAEALGVRPLPALAVAILAMAEDPALRDARAAADAALVRAGAGDVADLACATLPPGRRRLVEVARALVRRPRLLLLDEPAAGLTEAERAHLADVLREAAASGTAILVVEHALGFLLPLAHRVICLDRGRIAAHGTPAELRADPRVASAYFGLAPLPGVPAAVPP
jgi:branched-chain amino acid transport system permease protein